MCCASRAAEEYPGGFAIGLSRRPSARSAAKRPAHFRSARAQIHRGDASRGPRLAPAEKRVPLEKAIGMMDKFYAAGRLTKFENESVCTGIRAELPKRGKQGGRRTPRSRCDCRA